MAVNVERGGGGVNAGSLTKGIKESMLSEKIHTYIINNKMRNNYKNLIAFQYGGYRNARLLISAKNDKNEYIFLSISVNPKDEKYFILTPERFKELKNRKKATPKDVNINLQDRITKIVYEIDRGKENKADLKQQKIREENAKIKAARGWAYN